jgi:hypothetical protein
MGSRDGLDRLGAGHQQGLSRLAISSAAAAGKPGAVGARSTHRSRGYGPRSFTPGAADGPNGLAFEDAAVRGPSPFRGGAGPAAVEHLGRLPTGDRHHVTVAHVERLGLVGERVPEAVRVDGVDSRRCGSAARASALGRMPTAGPWRPATGQPGRGRCECGGHADAGLVPPPSSVGVRPAGGGGPRRSTVNRPRRASTSSTVRPMISPAQIPVVASIRTMARSRRSSKRCPHRRPAQDRIRRRGA